MNTERSQPPTAPPRRFASVKDLVKATASDEQAREFQHQLANSVLVNALIRTRVAASMTQAEVGEKMDRTQSAVSKMEHATDGDLTIRDMASYLQATGARLNLGIGKQPNRVERIKELAICLKSELEALADLSSSSDDASIRQHINGFFGEAWFNFLMILCDATSKLPEEPRTEQDSPFKLLGAELHKLKTCEVQETANC